MYINSHKSHDVHCVHTQINPFHHFVQGVIGSLPPTNHDETPTQGTLGDLALEAVDDERDALIQQVVQVRGETGHLRHHANLQPDNKFFSVHVQPQQKNTPFHLPKTGGPSYDGNGGSHFSGVYSTV